MPVLNEILLIAGREIRKNLRSAKGLVMAILTLLGGALATIVVDKLEKFNQGDMTPEAYHQLRQEALTQKFEDPAVAKMIADAPPVLLGMLVISIWLAPLLVSIIGFDGVATDIQHKTVRYWTVRTRRASYFAGKFFGLWGVVLAVTFLMHLLIWIVSVARGGSAPAETLSWGLRFFLVTAPISAAWCGLTLLISSQFKTPIVALLVTFATFFALWMINVIGLFTKTKALLYVYPNSYDSWILSPHPDRVVYGVSVCLGMALVATAIGTVIFAKRDV